MLSFFVGKPKEAWFSAYRKIHRPTGVKEYVSFIVVTMINIFVH